MLLLTSPLRAILPKGFVYISGFFSSSPTSTTCLEDELLNSYRKSPSEQPSAKQLSNKSDKCRPRRQVCQLVLHHFDSQYSHELGDQWDSVRSVLLNPGCWQYAALLNCFSDLAGVRSHFRSLGFHSLLRGPPQCLVPEGTTRLPAQRHRPGWLKQYYLLNAASLLPVLALQVKDGEKVLDLCSAPGGKGLTVLQVATPGRLRCNDMDESRYKWLLKTLQSYIPPAVMDTVTVTNADGRSVGSIEPQAYDKVLVDAPCSNDRSWLFTPRGQQGELWLRARTQLPYLQKELLCSALEAVRPGGMVVYSTCTLSRAENQSVVEAVLTSCPGVELLDLEEELIGSLSQHFTFARLQPPLGHLVIPEQGRTWGPMFVCRLRRLS
ncbi:tRNA (cytosine(34)-C(5))-methyltransferase, mitochondrial [Brachyhypopomus gauderio]|uniref:tRNA (cytosine(34)-C(5))-methyltransferase, mitochondrial n=1 Tax=Brachyhypopomus gauderio TaxID=698409 RepID=UPI0040435F0A